MASPHFFIRMFGFTDTTGSEAYNDSLSEKRINAVHSYLKEKLKLDKNNFYSNWQGEDEEKYDLHFPAAHVQQRYVDMDVNFYPK